VRPGRGLSLVVGSLAAPRVPVPARPLAGIVLAILLLAGCSPPGQVTITFENGSMLDVQVRVNGRLVRETAAGSSGEIALSGIPFPWHVEAVSPAGRVLTSMDLEAAPTCTTQPDGSASCSGAVGMVDMVCGRFAMWASDLVPGFPAPIEGQGEPCGP
jgi:hypothetical protein